MKKTISNLVIVFLIISAFTLSSCKIYNYFKKDELLYNPTLKEKQNVGQSTYDNTTDGNFITLDETIDR